MPTEWSNCERFKSAGTLARRSKSLAVSRLPIVSSQIRPILWSAVSRCGFSLPWRQNENAQQETTQEIVMKTASNVSSLFSLFPSVQFLFLGLSLIVLALVAGCKVGPDYKRPEAT